MTAALNLAQSTPVAIVEAAADQPLLDSVSDATLIVEACISLRASAVLLYASSMTRGFFDLSSGEAGGVLQKLRNYGIRLAVVADSSRFSSRFAEVEIEERRKGWFGVFATADDARAWLAETAERI